MTLKGWRVVKPQHNQSTNEALNTCINNIILHFDFFMHIYLNTWAREFHFYDTSGVIFINFIYKLLFIWNC